ncbi:MAG: hypothetical protein HY320_00875 [Armatimonadetes bacterium]|nr:hypothetical protein [Armatimonadota bacterium]
MKWTGWLAVTTVTILLLSGTGHAADVYCGSMRCFEVKIAAGGHSAQARADRAMNVLNQYLGGKTGKFTLRTKRSHVEVLLNGDLLVTVTTADVRAAQSQSTRALAGSWRAALSRAFEATKAQK